MLQAPVQPLSYSSRERRSSNRKPGPSVKQEEGEEYGDPAEDDDDSLSDGTDKHKKRHVMSDDFDDDDMGDDGKEGRSKSRRELPPGAVATLKAWLLSPEHFSHPYPTPQDQAMLMQKTGIDKKQLKNWFTNARRRIWKPMLKKQIETGQLTASAGGIPGAMPGLMLSALPGAAITASNALDNPHSVQAIRVHYQQAVQHQENVMHEQQQQQQQQQNQVQAVPLDAFGNPIYTTSSTDAMQHPGQFYSSHPGSTDGLGQLSTLSSVSSLGNLPTQASNVQLSKTDSHAVLMELFARDQDLVRQATESARLKAEAKQQLGGQMQNMSQMSGTLQNSNQHPMRAPSSQQASSSSGGVGGLHGVPTMNSWPHFSSITSLNNLGTIPGVKSITSLSGNDYASKGDFNRMGNLAQVKSMESMGKNDSYAFLEVFFGDRTSSLNLNAFGGGNSSLSRIGRQTGDEDNEIGLSLEDESPAQPMKKEYSSPITSAATQSAPMLNLSQDNTGMDSGTLKRAYDDALAARGLMSVSRSSEKLTDLVLPAKIQRTLSQEFISKDQFQHLEQFGQYTSQTSSANRQPASSSSSSQHQYPGQQPVEPDGGRKNMSLTFETSDTGGHVQVPSTTKCALCSMTNVDTQLRPCGHMFHERCLKPSLQTARGPPKCPIDGTPMHSAVLAVPTDDNNNNNNNNSLQTQQQQQQQQSSSWNYAGMQSLSTTENKGN